MDGAPEVGQVRHQQVTQAPVSRTKKWVPQRCLLNMYARRFLLFLLNSSDFFHIYIHLVTTALRQVFSLSFAINARGGRS